MPAPVAAGVDIAEALAGFRTPAGTTAEPTGVGEMTIVIRLAVVDKPIAVNMPCAVLLAGGTPGSICGGEFMPTTLPAGDAGSICITIACGD